MNLGLVLRKAQEAKDRIETQQICENSLLGFAEYVWPVVEPAIPFIKGWAIEAIAEHLEAVTDGQIRRLLINVPPGFTKSLMTDVFWPAWEWGPKNMPWLRYMCASYSNHLTERDNMRCRNIVISDRYKLLWGKRFGISNEQFTKVKFANNQTGWKLATSVAGIGTGERADRCIIDDPNNPMEMESEAIRNNTIMWFTEIMPDRLNSQSDSAIVVIQQRTHEDDVSGTALSRNMGYTHLMIPMKHDTGRHCITTYGLNRWEDPRKEDGELAWFERFPEQICDELERDKGPYAWCNSGEAPVLMADLSLKRIDEIKVGDKIVGFETGNREKRARLKPAEVLSISKSVQPVVRMMLDSEHVIRCTSNHKWFTGRLDGSHKPYAPAHVGSKLRRVCPPALPKLETDEEFRLAGWVSGFFDGEGSISLLKRRRGEGNSLITFHQSAEQNLPLCEKLEYSLSRFGFNFGCRERQPATLSAAGTRWQKRRSYYLKSDAGEGITRNGGAAKRASRLQLNQRFLHLIKPTKWRQRLIDTTINGRMYTTSERVVSIKPDGNDIVYGLETTTGNYVVWGLASSNSGQYQQSPEPRGGSIIKREWWQLWEQDKYPDFEYILAALDSAYTEKQENDPSALVILGVFRDENNNPKVMLMYAWQERLEFYDLIQKIVDTCIITPAPKPHPRFPIDRLIIERKASGASVAQELYRMLGATGKFGIETIDNARGKWTQDKVARLHSVQHLFADKMVYAPDRSWADMVIDQVSVFPRGSHDDLVDCVSMGIRYLRDTGFALRREESSLAREDDMRYISPSDSGPLYSV